MESATVTGNGHQVAYCHGRCHSEAEANARLIAAAPDMLAALRDAAFILRKAGINPAEAVRMADSLKRSADDAEAAIAKAEGRHP